MIQQPTVGRERRPPISSTRSEVDVGPLWSIIAKCPTVVTVVTTSDADGIFMGFTASRVTTVSAELPLLLVSVPQEPRALAALVRSRRFAVNFLRDDAHEVSTCFARHGHDTYAGIPFRTTDGLPVLRDEHVFARVLCTTKTERMARDQILLIGMVSDAEVLSVRCRPLAHSGSLSVRPSVSD